MTENFSVQNPGEPLLEVLQAGLPAGQLPPQTGNYRIAHVLNTYRTPPASAEAAVHQATCTTMQTARQFSGDRHSVEFLSVQFPEDRDVVPPEFRKAGDLQRSVLDVAAFRVPRKLPLLFDILQLGAAAATDADYLVYTNADINLMPYFYDSIGRIIDHGYDVIVVNRREVPGYSTDPGILPLMYSDYGVIHEGFDCFVFPMKMVSEFVTNQACVGAGLVMRGLLYNLAAHAQNMLLLRDCHLTFHLGQDRAWQSPQLSDYTEYNRGSAAQVLDKLSADPAKARLLGMFSGGGR